MRILPLGDLVAIQPCSPPPTTSAGIHYTAKENPHCGKGIVVGHGPGEMNTKGWVYQINFRVGDCVLYDKTDGYNIVDGNIMLKSDKIIAVIDKDMEIE
tara:strand:+ start:4870 stop:5166 length:297 start_codon:yes stop_codon:yes gene_type:complete